MNGAFHPKPLAIKERILNIQKRRMTPYIHCSKLNSVTIAVKNTLTFVSAYADEKRTFTIKEGNAAFAILSALDQYSELLQQCTRDTCITFVLSTPMRSIKEEIRQIRETMANALEVLCLPEAAGYCRVTQEDLTNQDLVDLKRINQILTQIAQKNREDTEENLQSRFKSLEELGIEIDSAEMDNITIPELPENLRLVLKHDDIIIGEEIGRGQSGKVFTGHFINQEEVIAVKVLNRASLTPSELESFRREVYALSVLDHPSLLKFKGYTEESPFYIVTEYMSNGSVFHMLRNSPSTLTPTIRSLIAIQVARGLEYLHNRGVIHRDLKSLNILLDDKNNAKIGDFGMAKTRGTGPMTGMIGTAHWMAPEVLMSLPSYDERVDVYSFGVFLWELLTGDMPYSGLSPAKIIRTVTELGERPPIPSGAPPKLSNLISKCWSQEPSQRPPMCRVVAELADPVCHFIGTDEAEFCQAAGIQNRHKSTVSMPFARQRRRQGGCTNLIEEPAEILQKIKEGIPPTTETLQDLFEMCEDSKEVEELLRYGFSSVIANLLNKQDNHAEITMSFLLTCRVPSVFDVAVLKALLNYATVKNQEMRTRALSVLVVASEQRFDFLRSAPSFVLQLLLFIKLPLQPQSAASLLQLSSKLISGLSAAPEGLIRLLIWARANLSPRLGPLIATCILSSMRFLNMREEITRDDFDMLVPNFSDNLQIFTEFAKFPENLPNDSALIDALMSYKNNIDAFQFLCQIAGMPRFTQIIVGALPIGCDTTRAVRLYRELFKTGAPLKMKDLDELYSVLSYLFMAGDTSTVCAFIKKNGVDAQHFIRSRIPPLVVDILKKSQDERELVLMMTIVYAVLSKHRVQAFIDELETFTILLYGPRTSLRKPAFLCIVAIGEWTQGFDFAFLLPIAAFYVNSSNTLMANAAADVIQKHASDNGVDLNKTISVFVENYKAPSPAIKVAVNAFASLCQTVPVDETLLHSMSSIYSSLH